MTDYTTSVDIEAPPALVFEHLVDPGHMVAWMGERAELEPVQGGGFAVDINGTPIRGQYLEVDPPRRVVVSWGVAGNAELPPGATRVEFTLVPTDLGTRVELVHHGLVEPWASGHARGWTHYLARLVLAASGVDPGPDRFPAETPSA